MGRFDMMDLFLALVYILGFTSLLAIGAFIGETFLEGKDNEL